MEYTKVVSKSVSIHYEETYCNDGSECTVVNGVKKADQNTSESVLCKRNEKLMDLSNYRTLRKGFVFVVTAVIESVIELLKRCG